MQPPTAVRLLEDGPAHALPERVLAAARELAGCPVALYLADLEGRWLRRVAPAEGFPDELEMPQAVGPEIPEAQMEALRGDGHDVEIVPLWLRHRALGALVTKGAPSTALDELARRAAIALELSGGYTDRFASARRRAVTTASSELQENLLPPRIGAAAGAHLAGAVLPAYEVGGDWFDHAEDEDGAWLVVADAVGKGPRAAALSAITLGAQRAARRAGGDVTDLARAMDEAICALDDDSAFVTALVLRWDAAPRRIRWAVLGHPAPLLLPADGSPARDLDGPGATPAGLLDACDEIPLNELVLEPGDRVVLYSDGVVERRTLAGGLLGSEGLRAAIEGSDGRTASSAVTAILAAVVSAGSDALRDDATVLVLEVTGVDGVPPGAGR